MSFPPPSPSPVKELLSLLLYSQGERRDEASEFCRDGLGSELRTSGSKSAFISRELGWAGWWNADVYM